MKEYTNSQISALIDEHIHSHRDRLILKRRLIDGICFEPLSAEFGLSVQRTKTIVYKAQEKLFRYLENLREMMETAPDDQTRQSIQRMIQQMEQG